MADFSKSLLAELLKSDSVNSTTLIRANGGRAEKGGPLVLACKYALVLQAAHRPQKIALAREGSTDRADPVKHTVGRAVIDTLGKEPTLAHSSCKTRSDRPQYARVAH